MVRLFKKQFVSTFSALQREQQTGLIVTVIHVYATQISAVIKLHAMCLLTRDIDYELLCLTWLNLKDVDFAICICCLDTNKAK